MRIISGSVKGKRIVSVPGTNTRPTSDRIKESIFNIMNRIPPATVALDLFAGTGALAIEALSRGATHAAFIDNASAAVKVIHKNLKNCKLADRARVWKWDIAKNLNCLVTSSMTYNLVFLDPPYNSDILPLALDNLIHSDRLANHAKIVIEHSISDPLMNLPAQFTLSDQRRYGKTLVSFLIYVI